MFNLKIEAMTNDNLKEFNKMFSEIYAKNFPDVVNYISFRGFDSETAQDIAQEVFAKALRLMREGNYKSEKSKIPTWLRTITNCAIIDYVRTNQYGKHCLRVTDVIDEDSEERTIFFQFADKFASTDKAIINNELKANIRKAFDKLNAGKERLIAHLFFVDEYEYKEIEELTMYPMGTIKGMINRIREKLQNELRQCA